MRSNPASAHGDAHMAARTYGDQPAPGSGIEGAAPAIPECAMRGGMALKQMGDARHPAPNAARASALQPRSVWPALTRTPAATSAAIAPHQRIRARASYDHAAMCLVRRLPISAELHGNARDHGCPCARWRKGNLSSLIRMPTHFRVAAIAASLAARPGQCGSGLSLIRVREGRRFRGMARQLIPRCLPRWDRR